MSVNSEAVKRWRKNSKKRIIDSMGGCCQICGYNRCTYALALHHIDPNEKEIGLGAYRANPRSWNKIVEELRKCVLLCHNCHSEVHEGLVTIEINVKRFDETYADYTDVDSSEDLNECIVCGIMKPTRNKYCSLVCSGKVSRRVNWDNVDLKYMLESGKTYVAIGRELGISDVSVRKRAKRLNLI